MTRSKAPTSCVIALRAAGRSSGLARGGGEWGMGVFAFHGKVDDRATAMECLVVSGFAEHVEESEKRLCRRGLVLSGAQETIAHSAHSVLEGLERQRGAAVEVPIYSALAQSSDTHDLGHRGGAIALSIEETSCLGHDPTSRGFAFLHQGTTKRPIGRIERRGYQAPRSGASGCGAPTMRRPAPRFRDSSTARN